jgi:hypothetical protein
MSSSPFVNRRSSGGSATINTDDLWKVEGAGFGVVFGDEAGGHVGEINFEGALKVIAPISGKTQTPTIGTIDGHHLLCRATINANAAGAVRLPFQGGVSGCQFTRVIVKRAFTPNGDPLTAGSAGRLYTAPILTFPANPDGSVPDPQWSEPSAVHAVDIDLGGMLPYDIRHADAVEKLFEPTLLWWSPRGTRSPAGSTFILEAWGLTEFFWNIP